MDVAGLTARVAEVDATMAAPAELVAVLADVARLQAWLTAVELSVLHRLRHADTGGVVGDPVEVVAAAKRCGTREAARTVEHADTLELVPGLEQALRDGHTTPTHLHTLAAVLRRVPRADRHLVAARAARLVDAACGSNPQRFTRIARAVVSEVCHETRAARLRRQRGASFVRTWTDPASGMTVLHGEVDPVTGLRLAGALECALEDRYRGRVHDELLDVDASRDHLRARTLVALVRTARRHQGERGRRRNNAPPQAAPSTPRSPEPRDPATLTDPADPASPGPEQPLHSSGTGPDPPIPELSRDAAGRSEREPATARSTRSHPTRAP